IYNYFFFYTIYFILNNNRTQVHSLTVYNDKLYFIAGIDYTDFQLWETDGTTAGTQIIQPAIAPNSNPLSNSNLTVFDGSLYFSANYNSNGAELWKFTTDNLSVSEPQIIELNLYPNPVNDLLYIKTEQEVTSVILYSITGQLLQTWENQNSINLSAYAKGIYLVEVQTPNGKKTAKIIKE